MNSNNNPLKDKSYSFALLIIKTYKSIIVDNREYVLSKQLLRSGTSIGANIEEANRAESKMISSTNYLLQTKRLGKQNIGSVFFGIRKP